MIENWEAVRNLISKAIDKDYGKPVGSSRRGCTRVKVSRESWSASWNSDDAIFCLVYHNTELVRWYPDGRESASLNGWNTVTTKDRISTHSRFRISSNRGSIVGGVGGSRWFGDETTWFFCNTDGEMSFEDGTTVPATRKVKAAAPIPKSRNPILNPKAGDAFQDPHGNCWIGWLPKYQNDGNICLIRYFGDHPNRSDIAIVDYAADPIHMSSLDRFVFSASTNWKVIPRFTWTRDNKNIPSQMRLF